MSTSSSMQRCSRQSLHAPDPPPPLEAPSSSGSGRGPGGLRTPCCPVNDVMCRMQGTTLSVCRSAVTERERKCIRCRVGHDEGRSVDRRRIGLRWGGGPGIWHSYIVIEEPGTYIPSGESESGGYGNRYVLLSEFDNFRFSSGVRVLHYKGFSSYSACFLDIRCFDPRAFSRYIFPDDHHIPTMTTGATSCRTRI